MPKPRRRRKNPEEWLSRAVKTLVDSRGVKIRGAGFHVANERSNGLERQILSAMGVAPGVADWIFTGPPLVAIELKVEGRKPSKAQLAFRDTLASGWPHPLDDPAILPSLAARLSRWFQPRWVVCRRLESVAAALADARIMTAPTKPAEVEHAVKRVIVHYWAKHQEVIP